MGRFGRRLARGIRDGVGAHGISALKAAAAAIAAWVVAGHLLPSGSDFYAPLVAVLSVHPTVAKTVRDSMQRLAAVGIGLGLGFAVTATFGLYWWSLGLVLATAVLVSRWGKLGDEGVQVPVAALLVLLLAEHPTEYAQQLIAEGIIGVLSAAAVNVAVLPPLHMSSADRTLARLRRGLADLLEDMSAGVSGDWPPEDPGWVRRAGDLDGPLSAARHAVHQADESTLLNPRGRRLMGLPREQLRRLDRLEQLTRVVRDLATALEESADPGVTGLHLDDAVRPAVARALRSVAAVLTCPAASESTAERGPLQETTEHLQWLRRRIAEWEVTEVSSMVAEGAVVAELSRAVRVLRPTPLP